MKKAINTIRWYLRKLFVIFGIVAVPYVVAAAYGMRDPGPKDTSVHGKVSSLETGVPIKGIKVYWDADFPTNEDFYTDTDENGNFVILLPKSASNNYNIRFVDVDGEQNGGFFKHKDKIVPLTETKDVLNIALEGEKDVTIHGVVRSKKTNEIISGLGIRVSITAFSRHFAHETTTDESGSFTIRVPERESYKISFLNTQRRNWQNLAEIHFPYTAIYQFVLEEN